DFARDGGEATAQSCAFPPINAMINDAIGNGLDIAFQNRAAAVSGTVINDDNLNIRQGGGPNGGDNFSDRISLVIAGDNDGNFHKQALIKQESRRRCRSAVKTRPAATR